jgi:hypothetical protein
MPYSVLSAPDLHRLPNKTTEMMLFPVETAFPLRLARGWTELLLARPPAGGSSWCQQTYAVYTCANPPSTKSSIPVM